MYEKLNTDLLQMDGLLEKAKKQSLSYLNSISERKTSTQNIIKDTLKLPENGFGTSTAIETFKERFDPIMVASSGPRYWGYVTGGSTPASIVGDWLATVYDQNTFATTGQGDISAVIEVETIKLLLELLELPNDFLGGFVTGATMSNFTCMAVARQWLGKELGKDFAKEGITQKIKIVAATPHSSAIKSLSLLGIGTNNLVKIKTIENDREAIDSNDLERKITEFNGEPFLLISSAGTVNTVDFDDFAAITKLKQKHNFWWHIDAAFGGFAACSHTHKHLVDGWQNADSITIDCHKWLNVPYESALFFIKEKYKVLQVETFQNSNAPYLGNPLENFSYLNLLPENSRRLKALPAWFSLMAYGREGYKSIIQNSIELALRFGHFIEQNQAFELLAPVRLNNVCFTLSSEKNQDQVNTFITKLNATEQVFLTPTIYNNKKGVRAAFVNWRTSEADLKLVFDLMNTVINEIIKMEEKKYYSATPLYKSCLLQKQFDMDVSYKMECYQPSGSFKVRGMDALLKQLSNQGFNKVIASSGGNAGYSLAYVGNQMGIGVKLIVPKTTSKYMIDKIKLLDAEVEVYGDNWDETNVYATRLSNELGLPYVPPFDHPLLWKGHSVIIDECAVQMSEPDKIVVAVGGGGLLCGIFEGLLRNNWKNVKVITAETEGADSFAKSFKANKIVQLNDVNTIATSLAAKKVVAKTLEYAKLFNVETHIVSDKTAFLACEDFFNEFHTLVEPACGAALSYVKNHTIKANEKILVIVCGGVNMGIDKFMEYKNQFK